LFDESISTISYFPPPAICHHEISKLFYSAATEIQQGPSRGHVHRGAMAFLTSIPSHLKLNRFYLFKNFKSEFLEQEDRENKRSRKVRTNQNLPKTKIELFTDNAENKVSSWPKNSIEEFNR